MVLYAARAGPRLDWSRTASLKLAVFSRCRGSQKFHRPASERSCRPPQGVRMLPAHCLRNLEYGD